MTSVISIEEVIETINSVKKYSFLTRGEEFQKDAITSLDKAKKKASDVKKHVISQENEKEANRILSIEEFIKALINELKVWIALKNDDPDTAWDHLVKAQTAYRYSIRANNNNEHTSERLKRLLILEEVIFPPQIFTSPGTIVLESRCSICNDDFSKCNHLKGMPYMGEFCTREITKARLLETSIVSKPANKHCRMIAFTLDNEFRNIMTWRIVEEDNNQE